MTVELETAESSETIFLSWLETLELIISIDYWEILNLTRL